MSPHPLARQTKTTWQRTRKRGSSRILVDRKRSSKTFEVRRTARAQRPEKHGQRARRRSLNRRIDLQHLLLLVRSACRVWPSGRGYLTQPRLILRGFLVLSARLLVRLVPHGGLSCFLVLLIAILRLCSRRPIFVFVGFGFFF